MKPNMQMLIKFFIDNRLFIFYCKVIVNMKQYPEQFTTIINLEYKMDTSDDEVELKQV